MPSGLRVTRIDSVPWAGPLGSGGLGAGPLEVCVNGMVIGSLLHRTSLELTVGSGELLLEVVAGGTIPVFQVLAIAPGSTANVWIGRRFSMGLGDSGHYLHVDRPLVGVPDRTLHPLNLSAHSALGWLQEKRALGGRLSEAQRIYLQTHQTPPVPSPPHRAPTVPSLTELGAFAALGLESDAHEAQVREAYRLLKGIHGVEAGRSSDTLLRLEEAFRVAMEALSRRVRPGVSEVKRSG